jgi:hypothetical protein
VLDTVVKGLDNVFFKVLGAWLRQTSELVTALERLTWIALQFLLCDAMDAASPFLASNHKAASVVKGRQIPNRSIL